MPWLQLKNDLESAPADGSADQLIAIVVGLVSTHLVTRKEALYGLIECHVMRGKFISFKVILEIRGCKAMPVDQCPPHFLR